MNFIYVHLNRLIRNYNVEAIYIAGPGHGGPGIVANTYLEGTYSEVYPAVSQDAEGMKRLFKQFSFPGGIPSHVAPETPGSIHEGGELGYALSHAFGAAFDNPELIVACVIGDGEAETGPLATSWHGNKFLNPARDGAVLPILHLNGYKIANPTVLARMSDEELKHLFLGYGYEPYFVEGSEPEPMHQKMATTLETILGEIRTIQSKARSKGVTARPQWPMIVLSSLDDDTEDPEHTPAQRAAASARCTWTSVVVNLLLTAVQITAGILTKSQGLVADGIHSLSDLVADFVVLFAGHHSKKDADEDHPYGHQRFETAASMVLGLLLLAVGAGMLWSAYGKLEAPETVATVHAAALWVAGAALLAKELLFRYMLAVAKRVKSSMLVANAWHARSDAASSLVVGIGIIGNLAGYPILDPIAALIVGFMVARMGWSFGWDALHDLMDRAVDEREVQAIQRTLSETPGVAGVHDVRTRKMGDMIVVDAHLEVDGGITVEQGHDIAVLARQRVLQRHRVLNLMTHVDPWQRPDRDHAAGGHG